MTSEHSTAAGSSRIATEDAGRDVACLVPCRRERGTAVRLQLGLPALRLVSAVSHDPAQGGAAG